MIYGLFGFMLKPGFSRPNAYFNVVCWSWTFKLFTKRTTSSR